MKRVCVVTSTRADYGLLRPLIFKLNRDANLEMRLAVTGSHLSAAYGMTIDEIHKDGVPVHCRVPILTGRDTTQAASAAMANAIVGFSEYFAKHRPDMLVVLGDRYEIAAVCCAAVNERIPIAHIHGGETTEGAVDECYRHSITKMSYLHFASCETYRRRIIQLGESPGRVFNVGALGVENALNMPKLPRDELCKEIPFDFLSQYAVVTFHPVTLEDSTEHEQCEALFEALDRHQDLGVLITKSNADAGGQTINRMIDAYAAGRKNCTAVFSLGAQRYLSALKYAACVIGNSSSGIFEVPVFGIPTVNIGDRQKGRLRAVSVIDCAAAADEISAAIDKALSEEFIYIAQKAENPYGRGESSKLIANVIKRFLFEYGANLKKKFYDIAFEVGE